MSNETTGQVLSEQKAQTAGAKWMIKQEFNDSVFDDSMQ